MDVFETAVLKTDGDELSSSSDRERAALPARPAGGDKEREGDAGGGDQGRDVWHERHLPDGARSGRRHQRGAAVTRPTGQAVRQLQREGAGQPPLPGGAAGTGSGTAWLQRTSSQLFLTKSSWHVAFLQVSHQEFSSLKQSNTEANQREEVLKKLASAHDSYVEISNNLREGTKVLSQNTTPAEQALFWLFAFTLEL